MRRWIISALTITALVGLVAPVQAAPLAPWGKDVPLTGVEAKSSSGYPGTLTVYSGMSEQTGSERISGRKYTYKYWSNSLSGDIAVAKGKELPYPFYASGYQWADAATARMIFARHFTADQGDVKMTVIAGSPTSTSAVFLWTAAEGPQWMTGIQTKGRYVASVGCSRPYTAVDAQNKPKAITQAVKTAMKACVVGLLAKQVTKLPAS